MSDKQHAQLLLTMAGKDLLALQGMMSTSQFSDEIFGFHTQQVMEKCCKAWLAVLGKKYPFTHDLSMLLNQLEENGCAIEKYWEYAEMTAYAMNIRYDGIDETATPLNRKRIIDDLSELYQSVEKMLAS
jgi:HEPN domain-containing protein